MKNIFLLVVILAVAVTATPVQAMTINVTTDIHAGGQKKRDYNKYLAGNVVYPKKWGSAFDRFLASPADLYIALGDNSNKCSDAKKYDKKIAAKVAKSGKKVLFGFGNHDCDKGFKYLNPGSKYYVYDKGDVRVIVLNTEEIINNNDGQNDGGLSDTQLSWLKEQLKTDKKIVIAMSKPAYKKDMVTRKGTFKEFFKLVEDSGNVEHIFGGDYHVPNAVKTYTETGDTKWHFVPALTLKGSFGTFHQIKI